MAAQRPDVQVRPLDAAVPAELENVLAIYEEAIPARERKPPAAIAAMARRQDYLIELALIAGQVVGFSISCLLQRQPLRLLEYMAVLRAQRKGGVGSALFEHLAEAVFLESGTLILEVDSDHTPARDLDVRRARKAFYRRHGCREIEGLRYRLPSLAAGPDPIMDLMLLRRPMPASAPKAEVQDWLESLYSEVYSMPSNDPRIGGMLEGLPGALRLV
jgi:GNAT superfamily N-acetyltransferase